MVGADDPPVEGLRIEMPVAERLFDPEEDDPEDYGGPWLLVEEWRGLWTGHPHDGNILSWLVTQAGLLDLAMLEGHRLKLPLRGFGRRGQTVWCRTALRDTRRAKASRKRLRWVRRIFSMGPWWTYTLAESQGPDSCG